MAIIYELLASKPLRPAAAGDEPAPSPTPIGQPA
jgi:hypothetical protein